MIHAFNEHEEKIDWLFIPNHSRLTSAWTESFDFLRNGSRSLGTYSIQSQIKSALTWRTLLECMMRNGPQSALSKHDNDSSFSIIWNDWWWTHTKSSQIVMSRWRHFGWSAEIARWIFESQINKTLFRVIYLWIVSATFSFACLQSATLLFAGGHLARRSDRRDRDRESSYWMAEKQFASVEVIW
jgi:hypothetical protein